MGEYEPNDSRNVTQKRGNVPGEPPRTGPREEQEREKAKKGKRDKQQQQQGAQSQSQSQSQGGPPASGLGGDAGSPERREAQKEGSIPPEQKHAIENPPGDPEPGFDQYGVNQPQTMHREGADEARERRAQAERQSDQARVPESSDREEADEGPHEGDAEGRGYGGRGEIAQDKDERG
jgi:hypothetical protein